MGTTTSSRAKRSQGEGLNISPTEEHPAGGKIMEARASSPQDLQNITDPECKENLPPPVVQPPVVQPPVVQPPVVQPPVVQPPVVPPPVVQPPVSHTTTPSSVEPPAPASQPPSVPPSPAGNHRARAALHLDLAVPSDPPTLTFPLASHKSQRRFGDSTRPTRHALVTPTEMRSLGKEAKRCLRNMEDSLGPWGGLPGLRSSPAPTTSPAPATAPHLCPTLPQAQLTENPSHLPQLQQASDSPVSGSACSFPLHGDSGLHGDSVEETLNLQMCHQVANELRHTMRRAVTFYNKVCCMTDSPEQQGQMSAILKEAFCVAQTELASVFPSGQTSAAGHSAPCPLEDSPGRQLRDDRTVALLEKYSEMLLFIAEKKMDSS